MSNPTRIVVDLTGTTLGQHTVNQAVERMVRAIRIGQFDAQTTRLVIELAPGYTVDPAQMIVQGQTPQLFVTGAQDARTFNDPA
ncbi:AMIN domain-containing protein [Romeria aff. gracilis LEGE 07310]|uniref:AMIN domain-containing protein n=1 Tax=Vasconcelosia minhoensis LEGE 07310 TaxID=915328 RepID=A0A8J7DPJ1_9CYAN|nr:AMIN domain-containing protein [Romeria aff. gracilis LEGE 07310]